jgi:hypothetical protein
MEQTLIQIVSFANKDYTTTDKYFKKVGDNKPERISHAAFFKLYDSSFNPKNNIKMLGNIRKGFDEK